ncbi:MAG: hypothetical protein PVH38_01030, partial [Gammaproteobacteria bacterium]
VTHGNLRLGKYWQRAILIPRVIAAKADSRQSGQLAGFTAGLQAGAWQGFRGWFGRLPAIALRYINKKTCRDAVLLLVS